MAISQELLDILACPKCKGDIYLNETKDGLICDNCKLLYEIKDDIPIMLIEEAKPLESSKLKVQGRISVSACAGILRYLIGCVNRFLCVVSIFDPRILEVCVSC